MPKRSNHVKFAERDGGGHGLGTHGIEITPTTPHDEERNEDLEHHSADTTFREKSLARWTTKDVEQWVVDHPELPNNVASELADHRIRGVDLPQITKERLQGYGLQVEEAKHLEEAVDDLLVERAQQDPREDVEKVLKLTENVDPYLDDISITEKPRTFINYNIC